MSLAVPLLLFDSDIKRIIKDTGSLFVAFIVGAISTVIGTVVAYPLIPLTSLGSEDGWKIAAALASRHIGGAINFVACCETLSVSSSSVSAALAADNLVVALYFAFLFGLSKPGENSKNGTGPMSSANSEETTSSVGHIASGASSTVKREILPSELTLSGTSSISVHSISLSLAISSSLVVLGDIITKRLLPAGTSSLSVSSLLTVAGASIFPKSFAELRTSGTTLGIIFVQMFFAASGAAGSIHEVMRKAPSLFAFSALQLATHFVALLGIGKYVCGLKARELYLASNANVGGPTTAAAMAQAKEWKTLVLPALLIGILGYATATPIGLALGTVLQRLPLSRG